MKKSSILLVLLSVAFCSYVYKYPPTQKPYKSCTTCMGDFGGQTLKHFSDVLVNYRQKIWDKRNPHSDFNYASAGVAKINLKNNYNKTDARAIWFSLDTLKKFICTIEKYNSMLVNPNQKMGIRFYYGVYEKNYSVVNKRNRHTLFMTPTYQKNANSPQIDFDPRETYNQQQKPNNTNKENISLYSLLSKPTPPPPTFKALILAEDATATIQNMGELCPTNCPSVENILELIDP